MAYKRTVEAFPVGRELTEVTRAYVKRHVSGFRDRARPKAIIYSTASSHFELFVESVQVRDVRPKEDYK